MAERTSSSRSMRSRNSRCDTPSLVTSTSELLFCDEVPSAGFRYFTRSVAARSSDLEKWTNLSRTDSPGAVPTSRQFQRWTSSEDRQLANGVNSGNGPPHDWKRIASDHLLNTRSPSQVSLSLVFGIHFTPSLYPDHRRLFSVKQGGRTLFVQMYISGPLVLRKMPSSYSISGVDWDGQQSRRIYREGWPNKPEIAL